MNLAILFRSFYMENLKLKKLYFLTILATSTIILSKLSHFCEDDAILSTSELRLVSNEIYDNPTLMK